MIDHWIKKGEGRRSGDGLWQAQLVCSRCDLVLSLAEQSSRRSALLPGRCNHAGAGKLLDLVDGIDFGGL